MAPALYARALTGASAGAALLTRPTPAAIVAPKQDKVRGRPRLRGRGYFEAAGVHRREPPRAARTPSLDFGKATRPVASRTRSGSSPARARGGPVWFFLHQLGLVRAPRRGRE